MDFTKLDFDYAPLESDFSTNDILEYNHHKKLQTGKTHTLHRPKRLSGRNALIGFIGVIIYMQILVSLADSYPWITVLGFMIPFAAVAIAAYRSRHNFRYPEEEIKIYNFSLRNNFEYTADSQVVDKKGRIFVPKVGDQVNSRLKGVLKGKDDLSFFEFGQYAYRSLDSDNEVETFYIEITLPFSVHDLVIDSRKLPVISESGWGKNLVELEGDFNKFFRIRAEYDYQVQAVTFLAPDLMAYLIDHMQDCDIEFIDDRIYFYYPQTVGTFKQAVKLEVTDPGAFAKFAEKQPEVVNIVEEFNAQGINKMKQNITSARDFLVRFGSGVGFLKR